MSVSSKTEYKRCPVCRVKTKKQKSLELVHSFSTKSGWSIKDGKLYCPKHSQE